MSENGNGNDKSKRTAFFLRVLLENVGGLLALAGVLFAAGQMYSKLDTVSASLAHITVQQNVQSRDIGTLKTDIAVVKSQVSAIENRQK